MDRAIAWVVLALVTAVPALFLAVTRVSSCADAAPGAGTSRCTSGPVLGVTGSWIAGVVATVIVVIAVVHVVHVVRAVRDGRVAED
ncbi:MULTISPECIES: hypothetical protein [unclassified Curtobacterium]|uniref:hypothetical protein n=1 Tax=unclassified Curtobacterium TaxID=257496 RepID=UPI00052A1741|nr:MULTISPECIES: hypothetical protein [unclassified Curtobacterium]AIV39816.1 hypothetical protein NI26_05580 [Curtobacterium sp. MR_MD2014]MDB6427354.1 hypothetical protein [Curtobacterium sp. 20TX0008]